jgi:hypothetical protein
MAEAAVLGGNGRGPRGRARAGGAAVALGAGAVVLALFAPLRANATDAVAPAIAPVAVLERVPVAGMAEPQPSTTSTTAAVVPAPHAPATTTSTAAARPRASSSYRFVLTDAVGRPARWDPCRPVRWAYNPTQMPTWGPAFLREGIATVSAATGLDLVEAPPTDFTPFVGTGGMPSDVDVVIAFGDSRRFTRLGHGRFAETLPSWGVTSAGPRLTGATMALEVDGMAALAPGFGAGRSRGGVLLHELGHVVGLDHVADVHETMNAALLPGSPAGFGAGDLEGLRRLGRGAGCFPAI